MLGVLLTENSIGNIRPKKKCENQSMRKSYALTNAIWTIAALLRSPGRLQEVTA